VAIRPEEELAAQLFDRWLSGLGLTVKWRSVSPDPPDLAFTVAVQDREPEEWAVEVTGLFQYVDWNGKEGNIRNVQAPLERLAERLNKSTEHQQAVTGYLISGSGPFDVALKTIEDRAMDYIRSGRTETLVK